VLGDTEAVIEVKFVSTVGENVEDAKLERRDTGADSEECISSCNDFLHLKFKIIYSPFNIELKYKPSDEFDYYCCMTWC
jgi:hypothetical protein